MNDLSRQHVPLTDLFPETSGTGMAGRFTLGTEQMEFYRQKGYVGGIQVLDEAQLDRLRDEVDALAVPAEAGNPLFHEFHLNESGKADQVLFHALGGWRIKPGLHDLLWNPAILYPASQLLGGPVRFWHDQLFCKPAHHGGVVAWHQDYSYWMRTAPLNHLTCWIGLDDATVDNGCLHYIDGSHRWELLPITGLAGDMEAIFNVLSPERKAAFRPEAMELRAGQCTFHHGLTVHGSYENRSPRPRRAIVLNFVRDGVKSDSAEPLLEGVPVIRRGEPLQGQFFPLLFPGGETA